MHKNILLSLGRNFYAAVECKRYWQLSYNICGILCVDHQQIGAPNFLTGNQPLIFRRVLIVI